MAKKRRPTTDALEILDRLFYESKPKRRRQLEDAQANDDIGRKIHALRIDAGLTQAQLAKLIGTATSVVCRLENADYEGHSLSMLRRIATALQKSVEIRFVPLRKSA